MATRAASASVAAHDSSEAIEIVPLPLPIVEVPENNAPNALNAINNEKNDRKRGPGILWVDLEDDQHDEIVFPTFADVQNRVSQMNLSKVGEKNGKVYRFKCKVSR